jgi:hypothetical protein
VLVFHYFLVWRREHFLISNFKETLTLGRLHVRDIISDYPTVQIKLRKFNRWVFNTSVVAIVLQCQCACRHKPIRHTQRSQLFLHHAASHVLLSPLLSFVGCQV